MLTSSFALYTSIENLSREADNLAQFLRQKTPHTATPAKYTVNKYTATVRLVLSVIFFLVELYTLFFMLKYIFASTPAGPGRNVKVILLIFFTVPFSLLTATLDGNFAYILNRASGGSGKSAGASSPRASARRSRSARRSSSRRSR
jgi:hypothetical protein